MNIIVILFPLALGLGLLGLGAFFWCMRSGQFADLEGAAWRVLQDDDAAAALGKAGVLTGTARLVAPPSDTETAAAGTVS